MKKKPQTSRAGSRSVQRRRDPARVAELEAELEQIRALLADTVAQLQTANERLLSSNEELLSANEELQQSEARLADQKESLELALSGAPTGVVLNGLVRAGRRQCGEDARTAVSMVDSDGACLRFAATDGMPPGYVQAADGFPIGPRSPSCGAAAYRGELVIVGDVDSDPLWAPFVEAAREYEIRACWSFPIQSSRGNVLGTFAVYHRTPREPEEQDLERLGLLVQTAAVIIEHHNSVVLRKSLEEQLLHIAEAEQRRIGEDLHDDVGQELTGLALTVDTLTEALAAAGSSEVELSRRIGQRVATLSRKVRFLSHGLVPVDVDAAGLMAALDALAAGVSDMEGPACTFECPVRVLIEDNWTATQLYRIAQEAVTNAVRHARAGTIQIALEQKGGCIALSIQDDGAGISDASIRGGGMGLRIMQYRANLMGARLTVAQASGGGTLVRCELPAVRRV